jgi:hypothetical protein
MSDTSDTPDIPHRSLDTDVESLSGPKRATAMMAHGDREAPVIVSTQCRTCRSNYRDEIERMLLNGASGPLVIESLPVGHGLSSGGIRRHMRKHSPVKHQIRYAIIEKRADEIGHSEDFKGSVVDGYTALRMVIQAGSEAIASGELVPSITELLATQRLLLDFERELGGGISISFIAELLREVILALRAEVNLYQPDFTDLISQGVMRRMRSIPVYGQFFGGPPEYPSIPGAIEAVSARLIVVDASDSAPAMDSASVKPYPAEVVFDSAPASDSATAVVIKAEDVPVDE